MEVGIKLFFFGPCSTVHSLEHHIVRISPPIGAGELHHLKGLGELAGRWQMRPPAEIQPFSLAINRDSFVFGQVLDDFRLIRFADGFEIIDRLIAVPHLTLNFQVLVDDVRHTFFNRLKILGRKWLLPGKIIVKPILDSRPDGHLSAREKLLYRLGQNMCGIVADKLKCIVVFRRHNRELAILRDFGGEIPHFAI